MERRMKNEGSRKQRRSGEAWSFPDPTLRVDGGGPAQLTGSPFPDTPNGSGPNRFLSPLKPKVRII